MHGNTKDLTGKVFGRLTVISQAASDKCGHARWLCQCECGKEKIISSSSLIEGSTQSCGCLRNERLTASKNPLIYLDNGLGVSSLSKLLEERQMAVLCGFVIAIVAEPLLFMVPA